MRWRYTLTILTIAAMFVSFLFGYIPFIVFLYAIIIGTLTFILYYKDKQAAYRGAWRIPERTLHLASLLGGWPGALIGQQLLRHKTQKKRFLAITALIIVLNLSFFVSLHTQYGNDIVQKITTNTTKLYKSSIKSKLTLDTLNFLFETKTLP